MSNFNLLVNPTSDTSQNLIRQNTELALDGGMYHISQNLIRQNTALAVGGGMYHISQNLIRQNTVLALDGGIYHLYLIRGLFNKFSA